MKTRRGAQRQARPEHGSWLMPSLGSSHTNRLHPLLGSESHCRLHHAAVSAGIAAPSMSPCASPPSMAKKITMQPGCLGIRNGLISGPCSSAMVNCGATRVSTSRAASSPAVVTTSPAGARRTASSAGSGPCPARPHRAGSPMTSSLSSSANGWSAGASLHRRWRSAHCRLRPLPILVRRRPAARRTTSAARRAVATFRSTSAARPSRRCWKP